ncbi:MAG TPA: CBS domain-containing protein [Stellaceae bacterium]|nr:CBS domain-containing protein [Stellaceae bacterium]
MQASEIMTKDVVTVSPDTPVCEIAQLLLAHGISAVPVVDEAGAPIGMVSEGDLVGRSEAEREARRDWWLSLLAEGESLHADFIASLKRPQRKAREIMSAPVVAVTEATEIPEIARLLANYRLKRVPVLRDGKLVGIVSRADLLRALAEATPAPRTARSRGLIAEVIEGFDEHFRGHRAAAAGAAAAARSPAAGQEGLSVADFQGLVADHARAKLAQASERRRVEGEERRRAVTALIEAHIREDDWRRLLHKAREAAERGEKEALLLRFPSELCADAGRAINATLSHWPQTLRGEAAEIYLRWERDLKPRGFHLAARVLDFPHGMPGDIGLFLGWGE